MNNSITPRSKLLEIIKEKHNLVFQVLKEENIQTWIIFVRETAASQDPVQNLVIGGDIVWESAFIFYQNDNKSGNIAIVGNFDVDSETNKGIWDQVIGYKQGISEILVDEIKNLNPNKIALNYSSDNVMADGLSHGMYVKIAEILNEYRTQFVSAETIISKIRSRKTKSELEIITEACKTTEKINFRISKILTPGMTELQIQEHFHKSMDNLGVIEAWQRNSCPAVDAGPDKVMGHVGPTELITRKGHTLHNDFGVMYHGYCSDIQRMWYFGRKEDIHDELKHAFETVHEAITRASKFIKPGVKGFEVDKVAREYVIERGYEEYAHALGHQVGTKAHDGGTLLGPMWERYGKLPTGLIEQNNVFTLELYVKTKNYGMVSLEEMIVVTENGCEFIVDRQEEFICLN